MSKQKTDYSNLPESLYDEEDYYIPNRFLAITIIAQSIITGVLFHLIARTYAQNNSLVAFFLEFVAFPVSIFLMTFIARWNASNPNDIKKFNLAFIVYAILVVLYIIFALLVIILAKLIKSGLSGGGNPGL